MLERLAYMFFQHFLLDECLRTYQTFVQQKNFELTWMLNAPTLSDQQLLSNKVGTVCPGLILLISCKTILHVPFPRIKCVCCQPFL